MGNLGGKPKESTFGADVGTNPRAVKRQEKRVARAVGGRRQPGSGSFEWAKGDVTSKDLMVSCKRTKHQSISITVEMLAEVEQLAMTRAVKPLMSIELTDPNRRVERDWVMLPLRFFEELLEAARERATDK